MKTVDQTIEEVSYLEAISQALDEEMAQDDRVFLMGEDIGTYGGAFKITEGFLQKYGEWRGHNGVASSRGNAICGLHFLCL